jgi:dihydrolipoamide dehydrogenase
VATTVILPKQGLQMSEGLITRWLLPEGAAVQEGQPLYEMETDKLTIQIDAPASGTLLKIVRPAGEMVPITETIAVIGEPGEDIAALLPQTAAPAQPAAAHPAPAQPAEIPTAAAAPARPAAAPAAAPAQAGPAYDYDLVIIGGGPGGYVAAIRAEQLGLKTAVIEEKEMGGTCLNWGCIPTKSLLHSAEIAHMARHSSDYGIHIPEIQIDYPAIVAKKDKVVKQLRSGVEHLVKHHGGEIIRGRARYLDAHTLEVSAPASRVVRAAQTIIATGSRPSRPPIPGIDGARVVDSNALLAMTDCPESLVIIGGGVIGVEFATVYSQLGKVVTIVEMMPEILPGTDRELVLILRKHLEANGVRIITGARVISLDSTDKATCTYERNGQTVLVQADKILVAIGRRPNAENLGLEQVGVAIEKGFVTVNDRMETSVPSIYAIGDVTGKVLLAHVASEQGLVAAGNAAGKQQRMDYRIIPGCIYTDPELASVGLTEEAAKQQGLNIKIGRFPVSSNGKSKIVGVHEGLAKIITDAATGEVLGAHILAPRATDMIAEICVAMKLEATYEEIAETIHPHPTVSEILMEAAQDVDHLSIHVPRKKF